jgi:hypothetical protein
MVMSGQTVLMSERVEFINWLKDDMGLSDKYARDIYCRCKRVEKQIDKNLVNSTSNKKGFESLQGRIKEYSQLSTGNVKACYALTGDLRAAVRKYAQFKYPLAAKDYRHARVYAVEEVK